MTNFTLCNLILRRYKMCQIKNRLLIKSKINYNDVTIMATVIMKRRFNHKTHWPFFHITARKNICQTLESFASTTTRLFSPRVNLSRAFAPDFRPGSLRFLNKARRCHSTGQERFRWNRLVPWVCRLFDLNRTLRPDWMESERQRGKEESMRTWFVDKNVRW